ncbi:MAG: twin-arginine translocase TatA/TatE family subunit [Lentisphaerae bacterium]|jgi:sec-independent protein translocase protein TatA|nr:twin-arginine translocase TatA/TatE family subunit [Lentisphaerota bacterium]
MGIGIWEWSIIFLIVLLLFGAKRLPEIARSLGKAANEFQKAKNELTNYNPNEYQQSNPPQPPQQQQQPQQQPLPPQQQQADNSQNPNNNPPQA